MNKFKREQIFALLDTSIPEPTTELEFASTFQLLIAVILSAQATDISVNKATVKLFKVAGTAEDILNLGTNKLKTYVRNIGLYNTKSTNIIKTCKILLEKYQGQVPQIRSELEALPGVGRKTANVVLNTAFGMPTIAVDTHVFRLSNRTKIASGKTVLEVEKKLDKFVPAQYKVNAHHLLILHGRYTCIARKPKCKICVINHLCEFKDKTN